MKRVYKFNCASLEGRTPPTQAQLESSYTGTTLENVVTSSNGIQRWIIPYTGNYTITCCGAAGGRGSGPSLNHALGGFGAKLTSMFKLNKGDILFIIVGQKGTDSTYVGTSDACTGAGGGCSAVLLYDNTSKDLLSYGGEHIPAKLLILAGGGNGGPDYRYSTADAINAQLEEGSDDGYLRNSYAGGGYNNSRVHTASDSTCGSSILSGAAAATSAYTRNSVSYAGFGGGGANKDDNRGGGGGGYRGGYDNVGATSFCAQEVSSAELMTERISGSITILAEITNKKLIKNLVDGNFYSNTTGAWVNIGAALTRDLFIQHGMDRILHKDLATFTSYQIAIYSDEDSAVDIHINNIPLVQYCKRSTSVDLSTQNFLGLELLGEDTLHLCISNDNTHWYSYNNVWQEVDITDLASAYIKSSAISVYNDIHRNVWKQIITDTLYLLFIWDAENIGVQLTSCKIIGGEIT